MDFDQLATFIEIAKLGSFSRAGQKLFRSQPAGSAQVRQLEQEYGEKLFDRGRKSVRLTSAGESLFEYAVRMVNMRGESLRAVADKATTPRGVLALGANEATCLYVLPELFAEVQPQSFAKGRGWHGGRGNCHASREVAELKNPFDFSGPRDADGESAQSAGKTEERSDEGYRGAATDFSSNRVH